MSQKIVKFKGRIDFKNDSKDKIQRTLNELRDYLNSYSEDEAAKIVESFGLTNTNAEPQLNELIEIERDKNNELKAINKTLQKIKDDLHDEQDTSIKARPKALEKIKEIKNENTKNAKSDKLKELKKDPLGWLKQALFGRLLGPLLSMLGGPIKALVGTLLGPLLAGLFAVGKVGFKLVSSLALKALQELIQSGIKPTGFIFKTLMSLVKTLLPASLFKDSDSESDSSDSRDSKDTKDSKDSKKKDKPKRKKAKSKLNQLLDTVGSKLSGFKEGIINKGKEFSKETLEKFKNIQTKVKSISTKMMGSLAKNPSAPSKALAKNLPKALAKFGSKFIPGVGMALLAYDVYAAAKKSDGVISFTVNLLDQISGGLLGLGFNQENLGEYVSTTLGGVFDGLTEGELNLFDDVNSTVGSIKENINIQNFNDNSKNIEHLNQTLKGHPNSEKIIQEYQRLASLKEQGLLTEDEAIRQFKEFVDVNVPETDVLSLGSTNNTYNENHFNNTVEPIKTEIAGTEMYDTLGNQQLAASYATMNASANLAAQVATKVSSSYGQMMMQNQVNFPSMASPSPQVIVQG